jgi:signal transduction histidine kinase
VLSAADWEPERDGPLDLNGQWSFYWGKLLEPSDFSFSGAQPEASGVLFFPGFWKGVLADGVPLPGFGQATFRLRLDTGITPRRLALRLFAVASAYKLWADGKLIASSGVPGNANSERPDRSLVISEFETHGFPVDFILQISNHLHQRGGLHYPIRLGTLKQLEREHNLTQGLFMAFAASLLLMALYHLALYFIRKKNSSTLFFSLCCLNIVVLGVTLDASDWVVQLLIPQVDTNTVTMFCLASSSIMASLLFRFYRSLYPQEFIRQIGYLCDIRSVISLVFIITQPSVVVYQAMRWLAFVPIVIMACFMTALILCVVHNRTGALTLLVGYLAFSSASLYDIYQAFFGTPSFSFVTIGMLIFVFAQALAMAQRYSQAFTAEERLSADLKTEMRERNRLEQEIVNVSEEERRRLSHALHDGLCQQLAGTRMRCVALELSDIEQKETVDEIKAITGQIHEAVSEAYNLSRGLWPVENASGDVGASLAELARQVSRATGIVIEYAEDLACQPCCNEHLVQLYRIAQEAVTNAVKHACPGRVLIHLRCSSHRRLSLVVRDDGVGRHKAARSEGGLGLRIMEYRARAIQGTLVIDDSVEGGTTVTCSLECMAHDLAQENANG